MAVLAMLLKLCFWKVGLVKRLAEKIWRTIFWNFLIRFTLEIVLEVAINLMITLKVYRYQNEDIVY